MTVRFLRKALFKERAGNTAMIFALLTPVLVLLGGGTVDLTNASMRQAALQQAADAAAVGSVAQYSPGYKYAALTMTSDGPVPDGVTSTNTQALFNANWTASGPATTPTISGNACGSGTFVCKQGTGVKAYVQAKSTFSPSFLGLIGQKTIQLAATAQATANTPTYINYYILVDNSQSMGIASTQADMSSLYSLVYSSGNASENETSCVFGCHVTMQANSGGMQKVSNEDLAHNASPSITLRIDSAKAAIQSVIAQAQQSAGIYKNINIGLYTMSGYSSSVNYVPLSTPISDYTSLQTISQSIDLGPNNSNGPGDTDFPDQLTTFAKNLPANGVGTASSPLNYVFIITDGLLDAQGSSCFYNHCTGTLDSTYCKQIKSKATVGVIYTTYRPITLQTSPKYNSGATALEGNYSLLAANYVPSIPTALQACSSDPTQFYFEADEGPAIVSAMQKLFAQTQKASHITN